MTLGEVVTIATAVWTWVALLGSIVAGFYLGARVIAGTVLTPAREPGTPGGLGRRKAEELLWVGAFFWLPQFADVYVSDDPNWPRVVSRLLLFVIFAMSAGVGTWLVLRLAVRRGQTLP